MLFKFKSFARIYYALGLIITLVVIGSAGFMLIEGYTLTQALYMTIITISTVGYNEVIPLHPEGQMFAAALIIVSIGTFAYGISAITTYFVAGEYLTIYKLAKMLKKIEHLDNHVIVCGFGRVGNKTLADLESHDQDFVVVEQSEERIEHIMNSGEKLAMKGDATKDDDLIKAGVQRAKALITTLPNDADNLYVVLTARELNKNITIISRASKPESVKKLRIAGANNVIMPDSVGGAHMASLVVNPDVMEFLDHISVQGSADINLEEVSFKDIPEDFHHKTLGELEIRNKIGINIIGFKTSEGEYIINPGPDTPLNPNSKFFVLGNKRQIKLLNRLFNIQPSIK